MYKISVQYPPNIVQQIKDLLPTQTDLHALLDQNSYDAGFLLMGIIEALSNMTHELNVRSVRIESDAPECSLCGDSGRCHPTLESPDGAVCACMAEVSR